MQQQSGDKKGLSKEMAKMLAQQEILRKMLDDIRNKGGVQNKTAKQLEEVGKMVDENIKDIVNKQITQNTINRQQQILTRLLESEKAENEREEDEKRESKEVKNYKFSNPQQMFKDKNQNTTMS